jgi:hypothetical protein
MNNSSHSSENDYEEEFPMAAITRIIVQIKTGTLPDSGTDGDVYLGIGGREFHLDSRDEDFDTGFDTQYVLGEPTSLPNQKPVLNAEHNDPRVDYVMQSEFLDKFPAYIRFEQTGDSSAWNLELARVTTLSHGNVVAIYENLSLSNNLWLGDNFGKYCYLVKLH